MAAVPLAGVFLTSLSRGYCILGDVALWEMVLLGLSLAQQGMPPYSARQQKLCFFLAYLDYE